MSTGKWHISDSGKPARCNAKVNPCPKLKADPKAPHFETKDEAEQYLDKKNAQENGGFLAPSVVSTDEINHALDNIFVQNNMDKIHELLGRKDNSEGYPLPGHEGITYEQASPKVQAEIRQIIKDDKATWKEEVYDKASPEVKAQIDRLSAEARNKAKLQSFLKLEAIEIPPKAESWTMSKPSFSRYRVSAYRGEQNANQDNGGYAFYGSGIYSTGIRKSAAEYGKVRKVDPSELPTMPLHFKDRDSFSNFKYEIAKHYNIDKRDMESNMNTEQLILKTGYDGITIGKDNEIIVMYDTERNRENS